MEGGGGPAGGNSSFSQEEQDVSKALEASLRESSRSRRKTDSHNPHDKKRTEEVRFFAVRWHALVSVRIRIRIQLLFQCGSVFREPNPLMRIWILFIKTILTVRR